MGEWEGGGTVWHREKVFNLEPEISGAQMLSGILTDSVNLNR